GSELPVFALDIVNNGRARPSQERRHDEADALAGARGRKTQHMLWSVVAKIAPLIAAEHYAIGIEQARYLDLLRLGPARRPICFGIPGFAGAPDRHANRDGNGNESARSGDHAAFRSEERRVGK